MMHLTWIVLLLYSSDTLARGGIGGESGGLMIGIGLIFAIGYIAITFEKELKNIGQVIGGLVVLFVGGQLAAVLLAAIGVIPDGDIPSATLIIVALYFVWDFSQKKT